MKRNLKKTLLTVLSLVLAICMVACTAAPVENAQQETKPEPQNETKPEPQTTESVVKAADDDVYYLGMYATLTGWAATFGEQMVRGVRLALAEINEAGGIHNRPVELIMYDDAANPEGAVKAVTRLIENDNVDIIVGGHLSPNIIASYPLTEEVKVLHIGAGTSPAWTNIGANYLFRTTATGTLYVSTFVEKMLELGEKTTALVSIETEFGQAGRELVKETIEQTEIELVADITYQGTETDFTGHISRIISSNADCVAFYGNSEELMLFIKQLRNQGFNGFVYTVEAGANTQIIDVAGAAANGIVFGCAYVIPQSIEDATSEYEKTFLANFVDLYGEMPVSDAAYRGYDQMNLIAYALNNSPDLSDRDANAEAFRSIEDFTGLAGNFDFTDRSGDGLSSSNAYMILEERVQTFDKEKLSDWKAANN